MENYIQNIELINNYLNKRLSDSEIQNFEKRLKKDSNFNILFDEHSAFLEGLKRQQLKKEIVIAKQTYIKAKWMKFSGISITVLTVVAIIYLAVSNKSTEPIQNKNLENNSIVVDAITSKKTIETSIKIDEPIILKDSISSKKDDINVETLKPIKNIGTSFKKTPQKFEINTQKDTVIVCEEGTKLTIRSNSFADSEGNLISGNIDLDVTEYYKLSDMLLAKLTTTSNGNLLETGGMLFIEAKKNETDLKLKENTNVEILFPAQNKKEDMQLFHGDWKDDNINWTLEKQDNQLVANEVTDLEEEIEVPFAVVQEAPIYPGCEEGNETQRRQCTSDFINKFVQRNFNTEITKNLGLKGRQRINVIFKINKEGDIVNIQTRANHPDLEKETNRVIALLPKMQPGKQREKSVTVPYSLPIIFQEDGKTGIVSNINNRLPIGNTPVQDSIANKRFEDRLTSKDSANISVSEVNNYILRSSKLGWINCDRFVNNRDNIKYKLKIKDYRGTILNMVFKSIYGVIPSWKINGEFDFKNVPNGEEILLIAIKKDYGKLYFDIVETKTQPNPSLEFNFKEVTVDELKVQLKKLDELSGF